MDGRFLTLWRTVLLLTVASCTSTSPQEKGNHYLIDVRLDPPRGLIDASVDFSIQSVSEGSSTVVFHLHRQLQVDTVHGSLVTDYELDLDVSRLAGTGDDRHSAGKSRALLPGRLTGATGRHD